ncbi:aldo/keto reductase [Candidatus Moduliflexus flocculans]|uniref:Aldo/keto reductase n=1 Tax=Candidatus Moduliflexus flocculans TaxID=1499966 RepID=A0A0S6W436_9BACT|nr:aldo/keto reductase [Candidatus Moduliflexus flocculans]
MKRVLGRSGIEVSAMGLGCWAIGGPWTLNGSQAGWSVVDDAESIRAIHRAIELGVNFFDTAANYGSGHSERILGQALKGRRSEMVIATKFGYHVNEATKEVTPYNENEENSDVASHVFEDAEASLRRLDTDYIDVYQLHVWGLSIERALEVREKLEELVKAGKIRTYGWSTDRTDAIKAFSTSPNCGVVQQQLSVMDGNVELLKLCEEWNLASINRGPLGMGLLTGKFAPDSTFANDDVRKHASWHPGFKDGKPTQAWLKALEAIREVLTSNGRTLAQGALAGIWARSPQTVPIPGFKNVKQVEENVKAMEFGALTATQMAEIEQLLRPMNE